MPQQQFAEADLCEMRGFSAPDRGNIRGNWGQPQIRPFDHAKTHVSEAMTTATIHIMGRCDENSSACAEAAQSLPNPPLTRAEHRAAKSSRRQCIVTTAGPIANDGQQQRPDPAAAAHGTAKAEQHRFARRAQIRN